jgi:hypothetical protein
MWTATHEGLHVKRPLLLLDCNQLKYDNKAACLQLQATKHFDYGSVRAHSRVCRNQAWKPT